MTQAKCLLFFSDWSAELQPVTPSQYRPLAQGARALSASVSSPFQIRLLVLDFYSHITLVPPGRRNYTCCSA